MTTRRDVIAGGLSAASLAVGAAPAAAQAAQKTFVLVHGAWHGGWCWRRVADLLEKRGHKVFAPTLTGLGERCHLLDSKVDLAMHVTDIVNLIKWERLSDIVLVGHSYGGMVITGVAEQMQPQIASIVFLDAYVPENGQSLFDIGPTTAIRDAARAALQKGEIATSPPPAAFFRVNEKDRGWVDAMCTPHPIATQTAKAAETGARERIGKKAYVRATQYPNPNFDRFYAKYQLTPGWQTYAVESGHDVMIDMPERLAAILLEA